MNEPLCPDDTVIRLVLVDDHRMFRSGVKAELDESMVIVGEAADVDEAIVVVARDVRESVIEAAVTTKDGSRVIAGRQVETHPGHGTNPTPLPGEVYREIANLQQRGGVRLDRQIICLVTQRVLLFLKSFS